MRQRHDIIFLKNWRFLQIFIQALLQLHYVHVCGDSITILIQNDHKFCLGKYLLLFNIFAVGFLRKASDANVVFCNRARYAQLDELAKARPGGVSV